MSDEIIVLSDKDQARKRINVFHGSASNWINMIKELIGNSLDVFDKSILNTIDITIIDSKTIEYIDSGKGIPIEGIASDGRKNYEAIFEKAFAGSKYNNIGKTVGQNGIFLYTLAATSEDIKFEIARPDGNVYEIKYHKGDRSSDLNIIGESDKTYSRILFKLDDEVWKDINFTYDEICKIAQGQAALGNVVINITDCCSGKTNKFYYENGVEEYFNELTKNKEFVTDIVKVSKTIYQEVEDRINDELDICFMMKYSNDNNVDIQKDFLNTADLIQHGTIQDGVINGLRRIIDRWLRSNNKYNKNEKAISKDDVIVGLNYICTIDSLYVEYDNQVKQKTSATHYRQAMQVLLEDFFNVFQIENRFEFERICNQVLINKRANEKAASIRKDIKKKLSEKVDSITTRPEKFIPCRSKNPEEVELILIEGDSAKNPIKLSRNPMTMAVYPLKGKVINAIKNELDDILKNKEVLDIFQILGCGMSYKGKKIKGVPEFDITKLNVGKILITTDRDYDGLHIESLLLALFYILAPELIKQGKIYILYTPLYIIKCGSQTIYAYTEEERNSIIKTLDGKKFTEKRYKGLGGLSTQVLNSTAMNIENRIIKQVVWEDIERGVDMLELCMSDKRISDRKQFIESNGSKYFDYSLLVD